MGGRLTTHVLDTVAGGPAAGMELDLVRLHDDKRVHLLRARTNADGRCDAPLLADAALTPGDYEIVFLVGEWRAAQGASAGFYAAVPIRFHVDDPSRHYHVPLILAPFGYSTYRGS